MITEDTISSEEIVINAPAELVWDVILDFDNYGLWNTFCPSMKGEAVLGSPLEMQVDLGNGLQPQVEYITRIEPCRTVVWSMENNPGDPIHADRAQHITPIDDSSCRYVSVDKFSGEMMDVMIEQMGKVVEQGFNACAVGLKQRAEELYQASAAK